MAINALIHPSNKMDYAENVGTVKFTPADVVKHTIIPSDAAKTPKIIGWSGPARVGTTALLFLLANHPQVSRIYFQPQKTLLREGKPDFVLHEEDVVICMKEVFGQMYAEELYDPIGMLLEAGVPAEKISWISMLRDPAQAFASWQVHFHDSDPRVFVKAQQYTVNQYFRYRQAGVNIIPLAYEVLQGREGEVLNRIIERLGLSCEEPLDLAFNPEAIKSKLVPGQAADEEYYNVNIKATRDRRRYVYSTNGYKVPEELIRKVRSLCDPQYQEFLELSARELGVALRG